MISNETPGISQHNRRNTFEHSQLQNDNKLHHFVEKHQKRYELVKLERMGKYPIDATLYIPKNELEGEEKERNRNWYLDTVESALQINQEIFKTTLPKMEYLFINTTEDWNDFQGHNIDSHKIKGDRIKGGARYPGVLCFTPLGLRTETNFSSTNTLNETPSEYIKAVLDHETAHAAIGYKYGLKIAGQNLPGWMGEGVPMVINKAPLSKPFSFEYKQRLVEFLKDHPDNPPSEEALRTPQKISTSPFMYNYGQEFLTWLIQRFGPKKVPDLELKGELDLILKNGVEGNRFDADKALQKTYFIGYKQAYQEATFI